MNYKYPIGAKECYRCKTLYPATTEYFSRVTRTHCGLSPYCYSCWKEIRQERDNSVARKAWEARNKQANATINVYERGGFKHCTDCNRALPVTDFYLESRRPDGLKPICKECSKARSRKWAIENPDRSKEISKQRIVNKPLEYKAYQKVAQAKRRTILRQLPSTLTPRDWENALGYFNGCCAVCGRQLNDLFGTHTAAADHWIPVVSPDCPGTIPTNIVPLCHGEGGCNNKKSAKHPALWLTERYGTRKANIILARVQEYFAWVLSQTNQEGKSA